MSLTSNNITRPFSYLNHDSFPDTLTNRQLIRQLGEILATCNRRYAVSNASCAALSSHQNVLAKTAACKILRHYVKESKTEYWECVEGMEEKLVPNIIGWLVRYGDVGVIYGVIRDAPWLLEKKPERQTKEMVLPRVTEEPDLILEEKDGSVDEMLVEMD